MELETIKVQHGDGYMIINKSEFDPKIHSLCEEPKAGKDAGKGKGEKGKEAGKDAGKG